MDISLTGKESPAPPPPPPLFPEGKIKGNKGPNIVQTQISNFRTENLRNVKYYKDINVCKRWKKRKLKESKVI